jgi:hypothetical protein
MLSCPPSPYGSVCDEARLNMLGDFKSFDDENIPFDKPRMRAGLDLSRSRGLYSALAPFLAKSRHDTGREIIYFDSKSLITLTNWKNKLKKDALQLAHSQIIFSKKKTLKKRFISRRETH